MEHQFGWQTRTDSWETAVILALVEMEAEETVCLCRLVCMRAVNAVRDKEGVAQVRTDSTEVCGYIDSG